MWCRRAGTIRALPLFHSLRDVKLSVILSGASRRQGERINRTANNIGWVQFPPLHFNSCLTELPSARRLTQVDGYVRSNPARFKGEGAGLRIAVRQQLRAPPHPAARSDENPRASKETSRHEL